MHWHRSLYWRIAVGFVLFLAAMLVVQAMLFVWVASRSGSTLPEQSSRRFSETVAVDLASALERDPNLVVVPPEAPFTVVLRRYAPVLGATAAGVLILGTLAASLLIFGPPRRRLRELEAAARRFGAGDLTARAPDRGGDEIAAVATAFNG